MNYNKNTFFLSLAFIVIASALVQSSFASDNTEKEEQPVLDTSKIAFLKKDISTSGEVKTSEVFLMTLNPQENYYRREGSQEAFIGIFKENFEVPTGKHPFSYIKFFGDDENKVLIDEAKKEALFEHQQSLKSYQKRPALFGFLTLVVGVAGTAAANMLFK